MPPLIGHATCSTNSPRVVLGMASNAIKRPQSTRVTPGIPTGTFGTISSAMARSGTWRLTPAQHEPGWDDEVSDLEKLSLPASVPPADVYADIETALLAASEQLHRLPSSPELPRVADLYRRSK